MHSSRRLSVIPEMGLGALRMRKTDRLGRVPAYCLLAPRHGQPFASLHHKGYRLCQLQLD